MDVTELIVAIGAGDEGAKERLIAAVYEELRVMAARQMRRERADHTLQPTALVHEAYTRMVRGRVLDDPRSREYVFAAAARAMRQILTDHARERDARKRGGGWMRVSLDQISPASDDPAHVDALALHEALEELDTLNPRHHKLVTLRLAGLTNAEIAHQLEVSVATVEKDWRFVRAWLRGHLGTEATE